MSKPGTEKAWEFWRQSGHRIFIPKSVVSHISQTGLYDTSDFCAVQVEVEEWFAEKEGL